MWVGLMNNNQNSSILKVTKIFCDQFEKKKKRIIIFMWVDFMNIQPFNACFLCLIPQDILRVNS